MSPSNAPVGRAWADIDLAALVANARKVQAVSGVRLLPMVKADGYGTGAIAVARALETLNPWGYGVATVQEGIELRSAGIRRPILVCSPLQLDWIDACLAHGLRPAIGHTAALDAWLGKGSEPFHLEFDTGMGRAGFRWDDVSSIRRAAEVLGGGAEGCEGVFTHFCSGHDASASRVQWQRFQEMLASLPRRPGLVHAANSAAALRDRSLAADLVRPGIFLYGGEVTGHVPEPVARLQARVLAVRRLAVGDTVSYDGTWSARSPTTVATLGIGYADGVFRSLSGRGEVEIDGRLAPIVGRVTMDMTMVAVDSSIEPGAVATIFGGAVSLDRYAEWAGTIAYEALTAMGSRIARRYGRNT